jgi:oligoendopeptidase F
MDLLPFGNLPRFRSRQFLPEAIDLGNWDKVSPLFDELEHTIADTSSPEELESWLLRWSELSAALDEEGARRYIAMTCHTDSQEAERDYLHFVEKLDPQVKPRQFKLAQLYVQHAAKNPLPQPRYQVFDRDLRVHVELFRPENVPLETEEARLSQKYQKLSGALTVQFDGQEQTLVQVGRNLEKTDRSIRQQVWKLIADRRLAEAERFDEIFDALVSVRNRIARNAGFEDYQAYAFRRLGRFDYTPHDCEQFHSAVEDEIMPLLRILQRQRRERLGLERLRPWDLDVDPLGRPPLRPFETIAEMTQRAQRVFDRLDPELGNGFKTMQDRNLLDLANRKGKGPGGYQSTLAEARLPFIFMNAIGVQRDVETILHEAGHAFHALATQNEDLHAYRNPPIEFCEVASMSMELLAHDYLNEYYSQTEADRARRTHLERILTILPWICTVDAFQSWLYTHPEHTRAQRMAAWDELMNRFGGDVDWTGYERARSLLWHRQLHIFTNAFYYIEYGIAQMGALQVWSNYRKEGGIALAKYKAGLALGATRPLPELFAAAGCRLQFGKETLGPLAAMLKAELANL